MGPKKNAKFTKKLEIGCWILDKKSVVRCYAYDGAE